jgi:hypothetical protein
VPQLVKKFVTFMERECSLSVQKEAGTGPYSEPVKSSLHSLTQLP